VLALGDSKSAPDSNSWINDVAGHLNSENGAFWRGLEQGRGGYTVQKTKINLTSNNDPATFTDDIVDAAQTKCETSTSVFERCPHAIGVSGEPPYIVIDLGVNDVGFTAPWVLPNQTTWQNDYLAVLDALHAQWPNALVYITKPYKGGGDDSVFDTMAGWVDNVVAARAFARAGDDERSWFKPNIGTYSTDNLHFNTTAGQAAKAAAVEAVLP
jgi:lysophospholipase L1-like esterase